MADNKYLKCNWAVWCGDEACPHFRPHLTHPTSHENRHPECEDIGTYCYSEDKLVNCVSVIGYTPKNPDDTIVE